MTPLAARPIRRGLVARLRRVLVAAVCLVGFVAAAQAQPPIRIAFVGDSMIDGIWGGLIRKVTTDECLRGHFDLGRFGNNGTGLTRPDKYNWPQEIKKLSASFHPDLYVVSLGLNDRQFLVDLSTGRQKIEFNSPAWIEKYSEQATELLQNGAGAPAGILWVGIPIMREQVANTDALEKNKIFSDAVSRLGDSKVRYVPPWTLKSEGPEVYKSIGPGPDGSIVTLRAPDGIHFTSAGYDLIASYLYPKIVENLQDHQIVVPQSCGR